MVHLDVYGFLMALRPDLFSVLERTVGIYGTAPTCHLSALARVPGYTLAAFHNAVAAGALVRIRAMRYSVYTLPVSLVAIVAAATRGVGQRMDSHRKRAVKRYERIATAVEKALADGPRTSSELRSIVDPEREYGDLFNATLGMMAADFRLVRTTTTGTWRSDRHLYARWGDWLPDVDPTSLDELEAKRELVERYVAAYGPVEVADVKWWTGWTKGETLEATDGIDLARAGNAVSMLEGTRLLPVWDAVMVAYHKRNRLLDPSYAPLVYDRYGNATSVVLHDGRVVGQWDLGGADSPLSLRVAPFAEWSNGIWDGVEEQALRIAALIDADSVTVSRLDEPTDLLDASRNRFLAPLSHR